MKRLNEDNHQLQAVPQWIGIRKELSIWLSSLYGHKAESHHRRLEDTRRFSQTIEVTKA